MQPDDKEDVSINPPSELYHCHKMLMVLLLTFISCVVVIEWISYSFLPIKFNGRANETRTHRVKCSNEVEKEIFRLFSRERESSYSTRTSFHSVDGVCVKGRLGINKRNKMKQMVLKMYDQHRRMWAISPVWEND